MLILSARSDLPTKLRSFELGANDYLSKPFSFDELVARVRVHLRRGTGEERVSIVRVGSLELDVARRQATVAGRTADLSDREFRLLYHLVSHPGEVVSRERLLSEVWGYGFDPGSNLVDGRSPDTKDAALAVSRFGAPDGWYPYVVSLTKAGQEQGRALLGVVEAQGGKGGAVTAAADALLRIAHPGAEDRPAARDRV